MYGDPVFKTVGLVVTLGLSVLGFALLKAIAPDLPMSAAAFVVLTAALIGGGVAIAVDHFRGRNDDLPGLGDRVTWLVLGGFVAAYAVAGFVFFNDLEGQRLAEERQERNREQRRALDEQPDFSAPIEAAQRAKAQRDANTSTTPAE